MSRNIVLIAWVWLVCLAVFLFAASVALAQDDDRESEPFAFQVDEINAGPPAADGVLRRDTPRSTIETYLDAVERDDFARAAPMPALACDPVSQACR